MLHEARVFPRTGGYMTWIQVLAGLITAALLVYLSIALLMPEKFQ
jgi:K+-transporting ATPase KdpF subunit